MKNRHGICNFCFKSVLGIAAYLSYAAISGGLSSLLIFLQADVEGDIDIIED